MRPHGGLAALALGVAARRYRQPAEELLGLGDDADVAGIAVGGVDGAVDEADPFAVELGALLLAQAEQTVQPLQEVELQWRVAGLTLRKRRDHLVHPSLGLLDVFHANPAWLANRALSMIRVSARREERKSTAAGRGGIVG